MERDYASISLQFTLVGVLCICVPAAASMIGSGEAAIDRVSGFIFKG